MCAGCVCVCQQVAAGQHTNPSRRVWRCVLREQQGRSHGSCEEVQGDPASHSLGKHLLSPAPGQALSRVLGAQRQKGPRLCP